MSATNTNEEGNITYYNVVYGKFVKRVEPETEGATKRVNKAGNEIWEIPYSDITGVLTGVVIEEPPEENPQWGKRYVFTFQDEEGKDVVQLDGDLAFMIVARFPNLDFAKPINIHVFKGKSTGISTSQDGERVDHAFKDTAPKWEAMLDGEKNFVSWDKTASKKFFEKIILDTSFGDFKEEQPSRPPEPSEDRGSIVKTGLDLDQDEPEWIQ